MDTSTLDPRFKPYADYLLQLVASYGGTARVTSARRSTTLQAKLYQDYLAGRSQLPAAPPGKSMHQYGLAVDIVISPTSWQSAFGNWWTSIGGVWDASDPVHFAVRASG